MLVEYEILTESQTTIDGAPGTLLLGRALQRDNAFVRALPPAPKKTGEEKHLEAEATYDRVGISHVTGKNSEQPVVRVIFRRPSLPSTRQLTLGV